jgi:hypothetical protein
MIPERGHPDRFWTNAARQLLATTAHKLQMTPHPSPKKLLDILLTEPFENLTAFFQDTRVGALVDPAADKMVLSIRATLTETLACAEGCL